MSAGPGGGGQREGWWGVGTGANPFLDQLVVWRELAFNGCRWLPGYARYESLRRWARRATRSHARDARRRYAFDALDTASTDDEVWNAAQRQLAGDGWLHGYLRTAVGQEDPRVGAGPADGARLMEALMYRYALDGRDPSPPPASPGCSGATIAHGPPMAAASRVSAP